MTGGPLLPRYAVWAVYLLLGPRALMAVTVLMAGMAGRALTVRMAKTVPMASQGRPVVPALRVRQARTAWTVSQVSMASRARPGRLGQQGLPVRRVPLAHKATRVHPVSQ